MGTPGGIKKVKKCSLCFKSPIMVTPMKITNAIVKVTTIWLVNVKLKGIIPHRLPTSTNMKTVKIKGK